MTLALDEKRAAGANSGNSAGTVTATNAIDVKSLSRPFHINGSTEIYRKAGASEL